MAEKYFTGYYSGDPNHRQYLQLHVYTISTDLANLRTTERADLYMVVEDASSQWWNNYGSEAYVSTNGNAKTSNVTFDARTTGVKMLIEHWDTVVTHNADGTKQIPMAAHHYSGVGLGDTSISGTYDCDTLETTPTFTTNPSITAKTETTVTVNRGATNITSNFYWSKDNSTWTKFTAQTATITGLSPNTSYTIYVQARNASVESYRTTKTLSVKTYKVPVQSLSSKTETSIAMNWSVDSTADYIWYSKDNGSTWVAVGSVNATSGSYTITGLTANTSYNIKTRVRRSATQTTYNTTTLSVKTYALPSQSLASKTETSITMNWSIDSAADKLYYSTNNGSSWSASVAVSGKSGTYTITGLTANTQYQVLIRLHRVATSANVQPSAATSVTTYQYPYITGIEKSSLTIGSSQTMTFYNPLNRTVNIRMKQNTTSGTTLYSGTSTGTTITFTPNSSTLYASIPSSQSGTAVYYVHYSSQVVTTKSGTYKITGNEKPTFTNFEYEDTDNAYTTPLTNNNQIIVNGYSDIKFTVSTANKAAGNNSATIVKYRFTIGNSTQEKNYSSSSSVVASFTNTTAARISVTAIDSRGLETTVSKNVTFKDYQDLSITKAIIERENGVGTKVLFDLEGMYWNGNFGGTTNAIENVYYRWRLVGGNYSSFIKVNSFISANDGNYSNISNAFLPSTDNGTAPQVFELGKEYEIQFNVHDKLYDAYPSLQTLLLDSGIPCTDKYKDDDGNYHIGINQLAEDDVALGITGGLKVDGEKITDGVIVSVSEPSTKEKVWLQHSKNIFNAYDGKITYIARNSNESYAINGSNKLTITNSNSWGRITLRISGLNSSTQYTMSANVTNPSNHNAGLHTEYNGNHVRSMSSNSSFKSNITFTTDSNGIIEVSLFTNWSSTVLSETVIYDNIQLEIGTSATSYETYVEPKTYIRNDNGIYEEYIPANETYSKSEIRIGTWINNKPLYRKVVDFGALPNAASKNVAHNISNLGIVTRLSGMATNGTYHFPMPLVATDALTSQIQLYINGANITIRTGSNRSSFNGYVIIEYTKTSD